MTLESLISGASVQIVRFLLAEIEHIIGIDLGTTNSVVAVVEVDQPEVILNQEGEPKTPSVVSFMEDGRVVVGEIARRQAVTQPDKTISSCKRLIGRLYDEVTENEEDYPFELGEDNRGFTTIIIGGKAYLPEQISALILEKLKAAAEEHLGTSVSKAIITVPAYFDDLQRQATLRAAEIAGLEVMRLINEPTAAAMAYGMQSQGQEIVAIYDFGGGTFDFSILDIEDKTFEVLASTGNSHLGGDDVDMLIVDFLAERFFQQTQYDLRTDMLTLRRLKDEAERAKCELSSSLSSKISLPFIAKVGDKPLHLEETLTRDQFEILLEPLVDETLAACRQGLKDANLRKTQMAKVILVGGSTRIPLVQEMVEDFFGMAPFRGVNPDEVVAFGAATQGAVMNGALEEVILLDVTPHSLGIEVKGDRRSVLIEKNSTIPIKAYKTFTTTEDNQSFVNVHLLQGESEIATENTSLGKFTMSGIHEAPAGSPRIRVEIFVNADGVVEVNATESSSGLEQKLVTSCSYLDANERRGQGKRKARRRRRRRRNLESTQTRRSSLSEASAGSSADTGVGRRGDTGARQAAREELVASFEEIDAAAHHGTSTYDDEYSTPPRVSASPSVQPMAPPRPVVQPASPPPQISTGPVLAVPSGGDKNADTLAGPATPPSASRPQPESSAQNDTQSLAMVSPVPDALRPVMSLLDANKTDAEAESTYAAHKDAFLAWCQANASDAGVVRNKVKFKVFTKQPEEARDALLEFKSHSGGDLKQLLRLYSLLCEAYPNYSMARRERASIASQVGDYHTAMDDLEYVAKREDSAPSVFDELTEVYENVLSDTKDATIQFKLVKMYLRKGDLDDAISVLQQLVQLPDHRNRANKVMGFCFWQKGLRYLAWQKFKDLPMNDEVKDILFRLSEDMEKNDELAHASHVLEKIVGSDINFRDTAERLKKVNYRLELMQDERYGIADSGDDPKEKMVGDRFELIKELNRGSMGIVYMAHDNILDEVVALKVLNDFLCADPVSVDRFKAEARAARKLTHQNIVRIHDFIELDHQKAISMEYIEGEDMRTVLARNSTLEESMTLVYTRKMCGALDYAHRLGIVHRDIKPANIMINEANDIKIADFGIAKVLNAAATKTGTMIVGTPLYMSPEQIDGRDIDQRSDIYSLGIMLYEMVSGNPPFYEGNIEYQHLHKDVPELEANISDGLRAIITKCLKKDPAERYQRIGDIAVEIDRMASEVSSNS